MQTMDASIAQLLHAGKITKLEAAQSAHNAEDMRRLIAQGGAGGVAVGPTAANGPATPANPQIRNLG